MSHWVPRERSNQSKFLVNALNYWVPKPGVSSFRGEQTAEKYRTGGKTETRVNPVNPKPPKPPKEPETPKESEKTEKTEKTRNRMFYSSADLPMLYESMCQLYAGNQKTVINFDCEEETLELDPRKQELLNAIQIDDLEKNIF